MGYKAVHLHERYAWIPSLIAIVGMIGCGGHLLKMQTPTEPAQAQTILSYGCIVAGFLMPWATMMSDFCVYINTEVLK
jgi:purine-cytosine permease-like protein